MSPEERVKWHVEHCPRHRPKVPIGTECECEAWESRSGFLRSLAGVGPSKEEARP